MSLQKKCGRYFSRWGCCLLEYFENNLLELSKGKREFREKKKTRVAYFYLVLWLLRYFFTKFPSLIFIYQMIENQNIRGYKDRTFLWDEKNNFLGKILFPYIFISTFFKKIETIVTFKVYIYNFEDFRIQWEFLSIRSFRFKYKEIEQIQV